MHGHPDWRSTIAITCGFAVILVAFVWNMRKRSSSSEKESQRKETDKPNETDKQNGVAKNSVADCQNSVHKNEVVKESTRNDTIPELAKPKWVKVGQVQELYHYPLKSGRGKDVRECYFTEYGMSVQSKGRMALRDRMFLVYNEETGRFQTGRNYPTMILVSLSAVDEFKVKLEAVGMSSVVFSLPKDSGKGVEAIECKMWEGEPIKCIDCGPEPAEWLSRFLTGTNSGLRLAYAVVERRDPTKGGWEKYTKVYNTLRIDDSGLCSDLTSYMLMSTKSLDELNEKLERPVPAIQFRPNILVSSSSPFAEDNWEWIKIGERAIIRNVKPCTRCKMTKINPKTGVMDKKEPLTTLHSFREPTDPERIALEGKSPMMGVCCGLYVPGKVKVDDDVFVHVPDDSLESNHPNAAQKSQPT